MLFINAGQSIRLSVSSLFIPDQPVIVSVEQVIKTTVISPEQLIAMLFLPADFPHKLYSKVRTWQSNGSSRCQAQNIRSSGQSRPLRSWTPGLDSWRLSICVYRTARLHSTETRSRSRGALTTYPRWPVSFENGLLQTFTGTPLRKLGSRSVSVAMVTLGEQSTRCWRFLSTPAASQLHALVLRTICKHLPWVTAQAGSAMFISSCPHWPVPAHDVYYNVICYRPWTRTEQTITTCLGLH
ncbi:hypothetical protein B0T13DRAFT_448035 [Neurospora crassa]|nr:hypothetical protein B0T13DRAFT_448035 [Neurospora crassa]